MFEAGRDFQAVGTMYLWLLTMTIDQAESIHLCPLTHIRDGSDIRTVKNLFLILELYEHKTLNVLMHVL